MSQISEYQPSEKLFEDAKATLYRGFRELDGQRVLLKILRSHPGLIEQAALKSEFQITGKLQFPTIIRPISVELTQGALIMEYFDGAPIYGQHFYREHGLKGFLSFALKLVEALLEAHQHGILHQNIRPINVLYHPNSNRVGLIGFAITSLKQENGSGSEQYALLECLAYMSPEQTGRLNRKVGMASDVYSLGVYFYQLLTTHLPFYSDDPMELVHCHLAKQPQDPREYNDQLPETLCAMVMKMLHKTPEDRYRGLFGLISDLQECERLLWANGFVTAFPVARSDVAHHFDLPQKLYGRNLELEVACSAFDKVCRGRTRLLLVTGPSGIGKSSLVGELRKAIADQHGYFISGACEEAKQEIPYHPLIGAFHNLVQQALALCPNEIEALRLRILSELGPTVQLIMEILPELELLIGKQPKLPLLSIGETKNRSRMAMLKFVHILATKEHPLVIFIDDLQWMETASMELIRTLLSDPHMAFLLLVGAIRGEQNTSKKLIIDMQQKGIATDIIQLGPIDLVEIQEMLSDTLSSPPEQNRSLAELALERTQGNPLHVSLYLKSLYAKGLLSFAAKSGKWNWDAALISADKTDCLDVKQLIQDKLCQLSQQTSQVLQLAACIGTRFSLKMLSVAYQCSQPETAVRLTPAIEAGLIVPVDDSYLLSEACDANELDTMAENHIEITYEFLHSRVQQFIYELMDSAQSKETHLRLGRLLLQSSHTHVLEEQVFGIVNQLNIGRDLMAEGEALKLAQLNLNAGIKARNTAAYSNARDYLRIGRSLLPENAAGIDYRLWFSTHLQLAEMEYLNNNVETAKELFEILLTRVESLADKALIYESRVLIFINTSNLEEAAAIGLEGLALFGIQIPNNPHEVDLAIEDHRQSVTDWLCQHSQKDILALPASSNSEKEHILKLLMQITPAVFTTNQKLFKLVVLLQMKQVITYGHNRLSSYAYASMGILLAMYGDFWRGYEMTQTALEVNLHFPDDLVRNRLLYIGCNLVNHWCQHVRVDMPILVQVFRYADEHGDLVYANYAQLVLSHHRWFLGESLLKTLDEAEKFADFARQTRNQAAVQTHRFLAHAVLYLRGLTLSKLTLDAVGFSSEAALATIRDASYFTGVSICHIIQLEVFYLRGVYSQALAALHQSSQLLHFSEILVMSPLHHFYHALLLSILTDPADQVAFQEDLHSLTQIRNRFATWCEHCPENFESMYYLICAEVSRLNGQDLEAMHHYQEAIHCSRLQGSKKIEALSHEHACRFFVNRSFHTYGVHHLNSAIAAYSDWGATAKVKDLRKNYAELLASNDGSSLRPSGQAVTGDEALDKITLLKAAQAISSEIQINRLLSKMMRFVVENAGAQRGIFIYNNQGRLMVAAEWHVDQQEVGIIEETQLSSRDDLAKPVINFVYRTRSDLVIGDVQQDKQFVGDPYLKMSGVQAVLCMPVLRQTELLGILYLENHLVRDTFTNERLQMLRLLTPQMAVSLENANYIANMASLNETLTSEVIEREKAETALRRAQQIAVANAHNTGKAEFANSVLHNINNVLNTVGLTTQCMVELAATSKVSNLGRVMGLIKTNIDQLDTYFSQDKRGQLVPAYLLDLSESLREEQDILKQELDVMMRHVRLMQDIIETQQKHAKGILSSEKVDLVLLAEDAVHLQDQVLDRHKITVVRRYLSEEPVQANRAELTHILINLVKNGVEAMGFQEQRVLTLTTDKSPEGCVFLKVSDTGQGIDEQEMKSMFNHGFTTKEDGHGFGLHYCRQAMQDMGGSIEVNSKGRGKGAEFILKFG